MKWIVLPDHPLRDFDPRESTTYIKPKKKTTLHIHPPHIVCFFEVGKGRETKNTEFL